jgi:hypothetical protein
VSRLFLRSALLLASAVCAPAADSDAVLGWYNGDWQTGIPGLANWYRSGSQSLRVYEEFVVPEGGWTVAAVFSNNRMDFTGVTRAAWEIRSGMDRGHDGKKVAGGVGRATQTAIAGQGPFPRDPLAGYKIEVDGLHVRLAPGRYWVSVAPAGAGTSFVDATRGLHAVGTLAGNGRVFFRGRRPGGFEPADDVADRSRHFSLGVRILPTK